MGFLAVTGRQGAGSKKPKAWVSVNSKMGTITLSCSIRNKEVYDLLGGKEFMLQIGTEADKGSFLLQPGKGRTFKAGERFAYAAYIASKHVKMIFGEDTKITRQPADIFAVEGAPGAFLFICRPDEPAADVVIDGDGEHEVVGTPGEDETIAGVDPVSAAQAPAKKAKKK